MQGYEEGKKKEKEKEGKKKKFSVVQGSFFISADINKVVAQGNGIRTS